MFRACCLAAVTAATLFAAWHGLGPRVQLTAAATPWTRVLPALVRRATPVVPGSSTSPSGTSAAPTEPAATSELAVSAGKPVGEPDKQDASPAQADRPATAVYTAAGSASAAAVLPQKPWPPPPPPRQLPRLHRPSPQHTSLRQPHSPRQQSSMPLLRELHRRLSRPLRHMTAQLCEPRRCRLTRTACMGVGSAACRSTAVSTPLSLQHIAGAGFVDLACSSGYC